jgi:DNA-binding PadR family transcriptional regulator
MGGEPEHHQVSPAWAGTSALRGPLLGLLVEQDRPVGAYRLSSLLMQRLPAWQITHSGVANLLKRLTEEGYATVDPARSKGYIATRQARAALEDWMQRPLSRQAVREDLHARIASASPHHAALLYEALEEYERECFELLDEGGAISAADGPNGSWRSLTINLTRLATDETLHGNIRWAKVAKRWLRDWVAASSAERLRCTRDESAVA